jgi:hypothetical protein
MFRMPDDFYRALAHARKAVHRGDLAMAKEWTSLVERHIRIAERHEALMQAMEKPARPKTTSRASARPKDPTKEPGYRNPWVWPESWTPEQIAEAKRKPAEGK